MPVEGPIQTNSSGEVLYHVARHAVKINHTDLGFKTWCVRALFESMIKKKIIVLLSFFISYKLIKLFDVHRIILL